MVIANNFFIPFDVSMFDTNYFYCFISPTDWLLCRDAWLSIITVSVLPLYTCTVCTVYM